MLSSSVTYHSHFIIIVIDVRVRFMHNTASWLYETPNVPHICSHSHFIIVIIVVSNEIQIHTAPSAKLLFCRILSTFCSIIRPTIWPK